MSLGAAASRDSLIGSFSERTRKFGEECAELGLVRITKKDSDELHARVFGRVPYDVTLTIFEGALVPSCACDDADAPRCRHIWAVLVTASEQGALPDEFDVRQGRETAGRSQAEAADDELLASTDDDVASFDEPVQKSAPIPWEDRLREISLDLAAPEEEMIAGIAAEDVRFEYVIDGDQSRELRGLVVELWSSEQKPDGSLGRRRPLTLHRDDMEHVADPEDRQILAFLCGARSLGGASRTVALETSRFHLESFQLSAVLPFLCGTGRARLRVKGTETPLRWSSGTWFLAVRLERDRDRNTVTLDGHLERGTDRVPLRKPELILEAGFVFVDGAAARLDAGGAGAWIPALRDDPLVAPGAQEDEILRHILAMPRLPRLNLPDLSLADALTPRPGLRVFTQKEAEGVQRHDAWLTFDYDGTIVTHKDPAAGVLDRRRRRVVIRRRSEEKDALLEFVEAGGQRRLDARHPGDGSIPPERFAAVVRSLLERDWTVEVDGRNYLTASGKELRVVSGPDWFGIRGSARFEGNEVPLPTLLEALRRGIGTVELSSGQVGVLPDEWMQRWGLLTAFATNANTPDEVRVPRSQGWILDALLVAEEDAAADNEFDAWRSRLQTVTRLKPKAAPPNFNGQLRPYQSLALGWFQFLRELGFGGCLADDMGLGKTVQVLALLAERWRDGHGPFLVVAPSSLVFNWRAEAERFAPCLTPVTYTGAKRGELLKGAKRSLVITTYGVLRQDIDALRSVPFDYVVLDEAQAIKNRTSQAAKAARLLGANHRLAVSGTPIENRLSELWSLLEFLNPGMLEGGNAFQRYLGRPQLSPEERDGLAAALRPFLIRRTKQQVAPELPPKTEQVMTIDLEPNQRAEYDELAHYYREALLSDGASPTTGLPVLEALLRLRQAASHPGLLDPTRRDERGGKLDVLIPMLETLAAEGHKALVFSQFTSFLEIVRHHLLKSGLGHTWLDGTTRDRQAVVQKFQTDPSCPVFLISLKAGGVGLNLTAADYVFVLDPWWNPAIEQQAIDRAYRIGQTRPVMAYRLISRNTVEEKVADLQREKRELADTIITEDRGGLSRLGPRDLERLLSTDA